MLKRLMYVGAALAAFMFGALVSHEVKIARAESPHLGSIFFNTAQADVPPVDNSSAMYIDYGGSGSSDGGS